MSATEEMVACSVEVEVAAPVVAKKNANRLNRIFRKTKSTAPARKWRCEEDVASRRVGVPSALLVKLLEGLTEEEKKRAAVGADPLTPAQEEIARRAARFGLVLKSDLFQPGAAGATTAAAAGGKAPALAPVSFTVDEETLQRRQARFTTPEQAEAEEAMRKRLERFGTSSTAPITVQLSEEDQAAMDARARRFAS